MVVLDFSALLDENYLVKVSSQSEITDADGAGAVTYFCT